MKEMITLLAVAGMVLAPAPGAPTNAPVNPMKVRIATTVEDSVVLYVFGYDSKQQGRIKELLLDDGSLAGVRFRKRGNTTDSGLSAGVLWQRVETYKAESL